MSPLKAPTAFLGFLEARTVPNIEEGRLVIRRGFGFGV